MEFSLLPVKADWHLVMSVFNDVFPLESKLLTEDDFLNFDAGDYDPSQFENDDLNFDFVPDFLLFTISTVLSLVLWRFPHKQVQPRFDVSSWINENPDIKQYFTGDMIEVLNSHRDEINRSIQKHITR